MSEIDTEVQRMMTSSVQYFKKFHFSFARNEALFAVSR